MDNTFQERADEEISAATDQYRVLVEHLPAISYIAVPDLSGTLIYVSPQIETLLGFTPDEWISNPELWIGQLHADDRERVLSDLAHSIATGEPMLSEYRALARDGHNVWFRHQGTVMRRRDNTPYTLGFMLEITARKEAEEALIHLALHDALTGLPNRVLLTDRLRHGVRMAQRVSTRLALLLVDLDHFKDVNDALGHQAGDALLQQVGRRMKEALRSSDTVARLGGDEFAMVLPGVIDRAGAIVAAGKIIAALAPPFVVNAMPLFVTPSIGIVLYPDHGMDAETLIQHADVAMYVAKRGGGGYTVYASSQDVHSPGRLALVSALRPAIDNNELLLYYQPKMDLRTGRVCGLEALVRWQHPELGIIPASQFIPLAEQAGLIKTITLWSLDQALQQSRAWQADGLALNVAINLSARHLQDPQLAPLISRMLNNHGVAAPMLTIELTESVVMADPEQARKVLTELARIGVRLAIDDFGTGYSSLAYLERLPTHELKIDKSFVENILTNDSARVIVQSIIGLGHNLGLTVVAEGVESQETWSVIKALHCDVAQGYYAGHPLVGSDMTRWLSDPPAGYRDAGPDAGTALEGL